jgi:hypothetical protein
MIAARIRTVALMTATLLMVGCGSNTATTSTSPSPTLIPTPIQSPRTLMFTLAPCTAECDPMSEGVSKFGQGTVRVDIKNYGYTLTVTVTGMTPNTQHLINFHFGSCATPDLDTWVQIDVAAADATGTLTSATTSPVAWIVLEKGRILTVHGDEPKRRQTHIACTNLTN